MKKLTTPLLNRALAAVFALSFCFVGGFHEYTACLFGLLLAALLTGCAGQGNAPEQPARLRVVATTYPVYLFANAVTKDVDGIVVERLDTGSTSCLHDYTLSVSDMKKIEQADVIAMNGADLEEFMEDALGISKAAVADCSVGVELLENRGHHHEGAAEDHDHGHYDPHYWMDPDNAMVMVENLTETLVEIDPENKGLYEQNRLWILAWLESCDSAAQECFAGAPVEITGLITFHDGFQYFCRAYDLPLLEAIEEEAGSEASAQEIQEITQLVQDKKLPVVFTEINGSDSTARAIQRETGCRVAQLSMLMDGPDGSLDHYYDGIMGNVAAVINGFSGEEVVVLG